MASSETTAPGGGKWYLTPGERVIDTTRRHLVAVDSAFAGWLVTTALGLTALYTAAYRPHVYLGQAGLGLLLAGTAFLAVRIWQWWRSYYVFTTQRVLLVEGIVTRHVHGLPLRSVIDTTYHQSVGGRVRGYGTLELNLSGQPGMRRLTILPQPAAAYQLVLSLINGEHALMRGASTGTGGGGGNAPGGDTAPLVPLRAVRPSPDLPVSADPIAS
jgi:hypothetical protein